MNQIPIKNSKFLNEWLLKNDMIVNSKNKLDKLITHVALSGGKYCVPENRYEDFINNYVNVIHHIKDGNMYFVEQRKKGSFFRFFIDFDYKSEVKITDDDINQYSIDIIDVMAKVLPGLKDKLDLIVTKADREDIIITSNLEKLYKCGVHFHFPNLCIDSNNAILLRSYIIQYLIHKHGERSKYNKWEDVIDRSVYEKSGLRMVYSNKTKKCCKSGCGGCDSRSILDIGRKYIFHSFLNTNKEKDEKLNELYKFNLKKLLLDTSISYFNLDFISVISVNNTKKFKWYKSGLYLTSIRRRNLKCKYENEIDMIVDKIDKKYENETMETNDKRYKYFKQLFKSAKRIGKMKYIDFDIKNILIMYDDNREIISYLVIPDSKYCYNVKRNHNSNHIYFILKTNGFYQYCHSESKNKEGKQCNKVNTLLYGGTNNNTNKKIKMSNKILKIFFPHLMTNLK